jgi:hypothetical protein
MAKNIDVAIICSDLEALVSHTIPLVQDFLDFILWRVRLPRKGKAQRPFVRAVAGITFHSEFHVVTRRQEPEARSKKIGKGLMSD